MTTITTTMAEPSVGVVGVGTMGLALAGHLVGHGHTVFAYDIAGDRIAAAVAAGARPCASLAELAQAADLVLVVTITDDHSRAVTRGLVQHGRPGMLVAIVATNHPATMRELAAEAEAAALRFIDAPVVFGVRGAQEGTLVSLCGGAAADIDRARPVLAAYSRAVHRVGPVGAGQIAKTCNNMLHWAACVANYEALLLAKRYGVDAQRLREVLLDCPARNGTLERWDTTRFTWHEKDLDVALDLAQAGRLMLPLFGQIDQLVKRLTPEDVRALLHGPEASYLGQPVVPLGKGQGGYGE